MHFKQFAPAWLAFAAILLQILAFDAVWCSYTTFKAFSTWQLYCTAAGLSLVLALPSVLWNRRWPQITVMLLLDAWLIANLMYYRTYFAAIPPSSYLLAYNLADFGASVVDSLRWSDLIFPAITAAYAIVAKRLRAPRLNWKPWLAATAGCAAIFTGAMASGGGFSEQYASLQRSAHLYASGVPMYTLAGHLAYSALTAAPEISDEQRAQVDAWLAARPDLCATDSTGRTNLVVILAESLESWPIGLKINGQEVTPELNRLVADSSTFFAPHILTQVKGGRSIDAQLLLLSGLMPLMSGTYSVQYPDNCYPTIIKAMHDRDYARAYLLTVDKEKTWNQGRIARSFGIDTILSYPDFELTEAVGSRRRLADRPFAAQIEQKMRRAEIWPLGEPAYVQIVTYSGHAPFHLPEHLRELQLPDSIPPLMADYVQTARYTDGAIGSLVRYLKSRPDYNRTLVVITGDHEGLANNRADLCRQPGARGAVSDKQFTPFIVLNAPSPGRHEGVAGQIDMYPTLIAMMGLGAYGWHGLGQSLLDPHRPSLAVGSAMNAVGTPDSIQEARLRQMHTVGDLIIRYNLLAQ